MNRFSFSAQRTVVRAALLTAVLTPLGAQACSSCGCSLSSDWSSQGYTAGEGFRVDVRYDYFNQNQLRSGSRSFDRGSVSLPSERELQEKTINRNLLLTLDYSPNADWGVNVQLPYFNRYHTTVAEDDTEISTSHSKSIGDVRVVGRFQGFSEEHNTGVQFGLKFATGSIDNTFRDGPQAGALLDRGLQPGTGTTDLLLGVYHFDALNKNWDYFWQAMLQQPLNTKDEFRPGTGLNANIGVRYMGFESVVPHVQLNTRIEKRESGANADVENSGATLVYLSPGLTVPLAKNLSVYGFFQVPVYQRVNGLQIEPRYTVSFGVHFAL